MKKIFGYLMLMLVFSVGALAQVEVQDSGRVWTTTGSCGEPQDVNHYSVGDVVYINGAGFDKWTWYDWNIKGQPHSGDPNSVVESGHKFTGNSKSFCFPAYTIKAGDWGEYKASFDGKHDNYNVNYCGDGKKKGAEQCDDGNDNNNDACTNSCMNNVCGDTFLNPRTEECETDLDCDDQDANTMDICDACSCGHAALPYCGDGIVNQPSEECDSIPGCTSECIWEGCHEPYCGDGIVNQPSEECDGTPDCTAECTLKEDPKVPEFTTIGAGLALVGAGIIASKKRKD